MPCSSREHACAHASSEALSAAAFARSNSISCLASLISSTNARRAVLWLFSSAEIRSLWLLSSAKICSRVRAQIPGASSRAVPFIIVSLQCCITCCFSSCTTEGRFLTKSFMSHSSDLMSWR